MNDDLLDDFEPKKSSGKPYPTWVITLLVLFPLVLFPLVLGIGTGLAFREIKSIVVSGGVLTALSIALFFTGFIKRFFLLF